MSKNVYYEPGAFGLAVVGECELAEPCYWFDTVVVWRRLADGALLMAHDSGCSCPIPFEDETMETLKPLSSPDDLEDLLKEHAYGNEWRNRSDVADLKRAVHVALRGSDG